MRQNGCLFPRNIKRFCARALTVAILLSVPHLKLTGIHNSTTGIPAGTASPAIQEDKKDSFAVNYSQAFSHFKNGEYKEAVEFFKKANRIKDNSSIECLWGMAQAYIKLRDYKNAIKACDKLMPLVESDKEYIAKTSYVKGIALVGITGQKQDKKKLNEAAQAFQKVLEANPDFNTARYSLGIVLLRLEQDSAGVQVLKEYLANPDNRTMAEDARSMIENPRRARETFAPDYSIVTAEDEYISSEDLRGKVVLLNFWGTWCVPCQKSIPEMAKIAERFSGESFILIGVDKGDKEIIWRNFILENEMNWTQHFDGDNKVVKAFNVTAFPTYIVIDHEGAILHRQRGTGGYSKITKVIQKALSKIP